jgi:hypothetical protein
MQHVQKIILCCQMIADDYTVKAEGLKSIQIQIYPYNCKKEFLFCVAFQVIVSSLLLITLYFLGYRENSPLLMQHLFLSRRKNY